MKRMIQAAALAAMLVATPALAQTYDPAAQGPNAADFRFGYDAGGGFQAWTAADFHAAGSCPYIVATACYAGGTSFLGTYFAPTSGNYQGALLSASEITFHPGPGGQLSGLQFVAPTAGDYNFTGYFRAADNPSGDGVIYAAANGATGLLGTRGSASGTFAFNFTQTLAQGATAQFTIGMNGNYFADTTGFGLNVTAVPEPASWGLMILGFGVAGAALRTRRRDAALVA